MPRPSSNTIRISGPKSCVEEFQQKMEVILEDLKAQVTFYTFEVVASLRYKDNSPL